MVRHTASIGILVVVVSVLFSLMTSGQTVVRDRDGNWWLAQSRATKRDFFTGFFDGVNLGESFTRWGLTTSHDDNCATRALAAFDGYADKYLGRVTNDQMTAGLDDFYADYKNRSIPTMGAVWIVMNGIAGMPKEELEKLTEQWRRKGK